MTNPSIQKPFKFLLVMLLLMATIVSIGCGPSGYSQPIGKFQSSSAVVIASTRLYVSELNKVERDHYIRRQLSARAEIKLTEIEAAQVFSQEGLQARLEALDQLAKYGELLSKLAKSDAPTRVQAEASDLGAAITKLSTTVNGFTHKDDTAFKAAVGPVASIVGEILNFVVQRKIKKALDKAITQGEAPINKLIAVIRNDIDVAYQRRQQAFSAMRAMFVDEYDREMKKGDAADSEKLRMLAERISSHEDRWEAFSAANPGDGLDAMAKAHSALVNYAKSAHKVSDFASLVSAMEAFAARAISIGTSVRALREV